MSVDFSDQEVNKIAKITLKKFNYKGCICYVRVGYRGHQSSALFITEKLKRVSDS